ncbi:sodium-independent sulfate anion transporter-like [Diaphorina citri]|uniref:Sodium-independent sulfate anion transporter-like n=1 Tax=Diaphorina citri TaxID=121845 RepID=A0A3Q0J8Z5_DIACI|nr:sodium-independent sulfate anion transporter-like [Diaphorina citri]
MPNKKSYIMSDEDENKDETGNVAINGNIAGGNIVLTGYNAGSNEDCTFDNRGFQLETHDTSKVNGYHNPKLISSYPTKDFACDLSSLDPPVGPRQRVHVSEMLKEKARKVFTKKMLHKKVPILQWLPEYNSESAVSDLVAGVTVGLTVIPQAIAYSNVAGLPPQVGLYSSFMACFVYTIFGSCKDSAIGPTAIMSILTRENLHGLGPQFAVFLTFVSGIVQLFMGLLQLERSTRDKPTWVSQAVPTHSQRPSINGNLHGLGPQFAVFLTFVSGIVQLFMGLLQLGEFTLHGQMAIQNGRPEKNLRGCLKLCPHIVNGLRSTGWIYAVEKVKDIPIGPSDTKEKTTLQKLAAQVLWFISTARNILVVIFCALLGYYYDETTHGKTPFKLSGDVQAGLPTFQPPPFHIEENGKSYNFFQLISELGSGIFVLPLLSILENISLAQVFSQGKSIDANQEMLALGTCNIVSSFACSMPVTGALSRGAVNNASGVKTTFGGVYTGIIVILSLQFFTPYFKYIPKASLAAVIIAAVVFMVEYNVVKPMWRTKKMDLIPALATFLSCLLIRIEIGMLIGVSINVLFLLYASARPRVTVEKQKHEAGFEYLTITPDRALVFPSVGYVRNVVSKAGLKDGYACLPVVLDSTHIQGADFTAAKGISSLIEDFVMRHQDLIFYNLRPSVVDIFQGVQPKQFKHCQTEEQLHDCLKESYLRSLQNRPIEKR